MHGTYLTPLGLPAHQPLGYRRDGRPIFPIAGAAGTAVLPDTHEACMARMAEVEEEMSRLARFEKLTGPQAAYRDSLVAEFDDLDARRMTLTRQQVAAAITGSSGGSISVELGSASGTPGSARRRGGEGLRGRALDALEVVERNVEHLSRPLLDGVARMLDSERDGDTMSRYVTVAADPAYRSAFHKLMRNPTLGQHEWTESERQAFARAQELQRAMSLADPSGGLMVPFDLDPAILLSGPGTSNRALRSAFTVKTTTSDVWHGVTSDGVVASWDPEASEVSDDSPALAEASIAAFKGSAFIPFSFEVGADAANFGGEMSKLLTDAKERLEATAFIAGTGSGQPRGLVPAAVAAAKTVATNTADTYTVADVYKLKAALPARWRGSAAWLANETVYDLTRQFATGTGPQSAFWADLGQDTPPQLLGKPAWESSEMTGTITPTTSNLLLAYGDLKQYVVVDRVGTTIELIPHLFGANRRPTGQRGFYMWFRTGGDLVVPDAVRVLNA